MDETPDRQHPTPPYAHGLEPRPMLDPAKPWLEAGRSWLAAADRVAAYDTQQRGGPRRWWHSASPEETQLRQRAKAARWHARRLDRFTARGWFVWHDRIAPASRNVVDHIMVGPGGVVVLQSIPSHDHRRPDGVRYPGAVTGSTLDVTMQLLRDQVVPSIHDTALALLPEGWEVPVRGHNVLIDKTLAATYDDVLRPQQVPAFVDGAGAWFSPLDIQTLAAVLDQAVPPAPLDG